MWLARVMTSQNNLKRTLNRGLQLLSFSLSRAYSFYAVTVHIGSIDYLRHPWLTSPIEPRGVTTKMEQRVTIRTKQLFPHACQQLILKLLCQTRVMTCLSATVDLSPHDSMQDHFFTDKISCQSSLTFGHPTFWCEENTVMLAFK